jgi:hypothetical protein
VALSNTDTFIDEVTEEVRRDRLFAALRRYGWIGVVAVLVIVGGAAWNEWRKAEAAAQAQALGDRVLEALDADDPRVRATALSEVPATGDAAVLVALMAAASERDAGDPAAAAARLAALEADATLAPLYRQLATLKRLMLDAAAGGTPPADRIAALTPLTAPGAPFRQLAEEQIALAEAEAGDTEAAIARLRALLQEDGVSMGLRTRAGQTIVALGGDPESVPGAE